MGDFVDDGLLEGSRIGDTIRSNRVAVWVTNELAIILLAFNTVQVLGEQVDTQLTPSVARLVGSIDGIIG